MCITRDKSTYIVVRGPLPVCADSKFDHWRLSNKTQLLTPTLTLSQAMLTNGFVSSALKALYRIQPQQDEAFWGTWMWLGSVGYILGMKIFVFQKPFFVNPTPESAQNSSQHPNLWRLSRYIGFVFFWSFITDCTNVKSQSTHYLRDVFFPIILKQNPIDKIWCSDAEKPLGLSRRSLETGRYRSNFPQIYLHGTGNY